MHERVFFCVYASLTAQFYCIYVCVFHALDVLTAQSLIESIT